ncbi:hypothetical protein [Erythrobacter mangrovi]|uniref:Uncharacterized protein n=1 Tax=Erythrobacter mangrovi TaxID=2739433 RepID=A0A7D4C585_9SPHN|nr:hypothetical protein [Erythrobacter mangrovi]QKG71885.1 hypothetical protein HQR01_11240 [Erythrobacter mangrovi]
MTFNASSLLSGLPDTLRRELLDEYRQIVSNFYEGRWGPSELSAGRFCEVAYTIIRGRADGSYPAHGAKPHPFDGKCRALESETSLERGLRLLAARILPALYEIRNNRNVGHIGGEVSSNEMDATYALAASSWVLAELIRVFHVTTAEEAEHAVRQISELRTPVIWSSGEVRRVLKDGIKLEDELLLLIASAGNCSTEELIKWTETSNPTYLRKRLRELHKNRMIEASNMNAIHTTPKAAARVRNLLES